MANVSKLFDRSTVEDVFDGVWFLSEVVIHRPNAGLLPHLRVYLLEDSDFFIILGRCKCANCVLLTYSYGILPTLSVL